MSSEYIHILLADDDKDDCMFFQEALEELALPTKLTTVHDGEQLMQLLDLNMPRKNGIVCLTEIKSSEVLTSLPINILSTSYDAKFADQLFTNGAFRYICKPAEYSELKSVIQQALTLIPLGKEDYSRIEGYHRSEYLLNKLPATPH